MLGCTVTGFVFAGETPAEAEPDCSTLFSKLDQRYSRIVATFDSPIAGLEDQDLKAMESLLFKGFERCPKNARLFTLMGEVQLTLGQLPLAGVYAQKAVEFDASYWRGHQLRGTTLAMLGQSTEGLPHLERAMALQPENERLKLNLATVLFEVKAYDRVLAIADALVDSKEAMVTGAAHNLRGRVYLKQGRIKDAGREFTAAEKQGVDPRRYMIDRRVLEHFRAEGESQEAQ